MTGVRQSRARSPVLTIVCLGVIGALSVALWRNLYMPIDVSAKTPASIETQKRAALAPPPTHHNLQLSRYSETRARPLFNLDRRPFRAPAVKKTKHKPSPQKIRARTTPVRRYRLLGVLINETSKKALIGSNLDKAGKWFDKGANLDGWRIIKINHDRVTLERGGEENNLMLYADLP